MSGLSDNAKARLAEWYSARGTLAVMGEFSSGKSSLLNLLLGERVLPMQATATSLPPVWFTAPDGGPECQALMRDGRLQPITLEDAASSDDDDLLLVRMTHDAALLDGIDVIDTPGISDPHMAKDALDFLKPYLDAAIWCSAAEQAWRATEAKFWKSLPKDLHENGILVVTRIDQIRKAKDAGRIMKRVQREAGSLFAEALALATPAARAARADDDQSAWNASGGAALMSALDGRLTAARDACSRREPLGEAQTVSATEPVRPIFTAKPPHSEKPQTQLCKEQEGVPGLAELLATEIPSNGHPEEVLDQIFRTFESYQKPSDDHRAVIERILRPERHDGIEWTRAMTQIARDLEDFRSGPLRRLSPPPA
ncbi:dynamin family protein [Jannaschia aquimarina]|uniref:Era_2 protein n=1 Tax=Jannaschia aquimarina TaxID=935700 RepID=A0A0D1EGK8_9RHOB|nr:dynamin family protein [Jannaschia aquimarina]KIT14980.1 GTPase Era [Jannaschia aquimarina]SNS61089.1 Dynamin family protein [Jannaschia aquimarina]